LRLVSCLNFCQTFSAKCLPVNASAYDVSMGGPEDLPQ